MQFNRIHRRAGAMLTIALAATAISASAASARVLDGPLHQTEQASPATPPILAPVPAAALRANEGRGLGHISPAPATAHYSSADLNAYAKPAPHATVQVSKVTAPSDSFHWGDAAIGGAVALAIVLLVTAGTLVVRRRTQLSGA